MNKIDEKEIKPEKDTRDNKHLLIDIGDALSCENYHRLARVFYNYAERKDVDKIKFREFLEWFDNNWKSVLT